MRKSEGNMICKCTLYRWQVRLFCDSAKIVISFWYFLICKCYSSEVIFTNQSGQYIWLVTCKIDIRRDQEAHGMMVVTGSREVETPPKQTGTSWCPPFLLSIARHDLSLSSKYWHRLMNSTIAWVPKHLSLHCCYVNLAIEFLSCYQNDDSGEKELGRQYKRCHF